MFKKLLFMCTLTLIAMSCQLNETMVLNEDGSGTIALEIDFSEMLAFTGDMEKDSTKVRLDTVVHMKDFLAEEKDSISKLSVAQQQQLKKLENFNFRTLMDYETTEFFFRVYSDFKKVDEANELMNAFENSGAFMQGTGSDVKVGNDEDSEGIVGVKYSYKKGKFKRDAYIKDESKHEAQIDSMKQAEAFMSEMKYKIKYTFPKKIKKVNVDDATFSLDGKTLELTRSMLDYMKNPDVLDLEVELEN